MLWIKCLSLSDFKSESPEKDVAVVCIHDDATTITNMDGWKCAHTSLFTDVEYDEEYLSIWGWRIANEAGLFTPSKAIDLLHYLHSEEVRTAQGMIIHCHAGRSRSVAVGQFASKIYDAELITSHTVEPNKTVLKLLEDPTAMGNEFFIEEDKKEKIDQKHSFLWWLGLSAD